MMADTTPISGALTPVAPRRGRPPKSPDTGNPEAQARPEDAILPQEKRQRRRGGLGQRQTYLAYPARDGFHRRWINDTPGRVAYAKECGWTHVMEDGKPVVRTVNKSVESGGLQGYIMEIPQEYYDEDQAVKMQALDVIDEQLKRGRYNDGDTKGDHRYIPEKGEAIKFGVSKG